MKPYPDQERLAAAWESGDRERIAGALAEVTRRLVEFAEIPPGLDRDDLAQEATIAALKHLQTYEPAKGTLRTYVYGSVRFTIKDRSRQERRRAARFHQNEDALLAAPAGRPRPSGSPSEPRGRTRPKPAATAPPRKSRRRTRPGDPASWGFPGGPPGRRRRSAPGQLWLLACAPL